MQAIHQQVHPYGQLGLPCQQTMPMIHLEVPVSHQHVPMIHLEVPVTHRQVPMIHLEVPVTHRQMQPSHRQMQMNRQQAVIPWWLQRAPTTERDGMGT